MGGGIRPTIGFTLDVGKHKSLTLSEEISSKFQWGSVISPLPADQLAVAVLAAWAIFDAAGVTHDAAAQADFERDVWDRDGFPEPGPTEVLKIADVWSEAEAAARRALKVRWPRLRTAWISLRLDGPSLAA